LPQEKHIKTVRVKANTGNTDTDGKIILKLILRKDGYVWTGFT